MRHLEVLTTVPVGSSTMNERTRACTHAHTYKHQCKTATEKRLIPQYNHAVSLGPVPLYNRAIAVFQSAGQCLTPVQDI
eukprot:364071-Chlamydomonas_euryale.AAC.6